MTNVAHDLYIPADARLVGATVRVVATESATGRCVLATDDGRVEARRAPSCLVEPAAGDRVLCALVDGRAYVLAVLERDEEQPAELVFAAGARVRGGKGRLSLSAEEGVDLASSGEATVTAPRLSLSTSEGKLFANRFGVIAGRVDAELGRLGVVAESIDTVAKRMRHHLERCYRLVEGIDQLRAGTIDMKADRFARLHAEDTVVTAEALVKVDGAQIHLG